MSIIAYSFTNLLGVAVILIWASLLTMMLIGWISGNIYEKNFYIVICNILDEKNFDLNHCTDSIKNGYEVYRRHRFGFASKGIITICQEFSSNMRRRIRFDNMSGQNKSIWADRLDKVINQLQYEETFDDKKANDIISELNGKISDKSIGEIKQKLVFLEAYHKGVVSVKNMEILELKDKMKREKWIIRVSGIIGVVGSLASIASFLM